MQNNKQSPGSVLNALLEKHGLNCNRLAKAINMSNAMVRLLVLDKSPISLAAAFRLAKFFKTKPEQWLLLQMKYDLECAAADKKLARELSGITDVSKYSFERKPHAKKRAKTKVGRKTGKKKMTLADKRKAAGRVPGAKPARRKRRK